MAPSGAVRVELADTPFFPQEDYECGPAALATVLHEKDRPVSPDELAPAVYIPGRRGSLQTELIAATRAHERLPYLIAPRLDEALAQLGSGRPVLVFQNLGLRMIPLWHFAVLVGYDAPSNTVVLRSGTTERRVMKARHFDRSWKRAGRWGLVALPPGELPANPDPDRYLAAAAGLEAVGRTDAARVAFERAREEWPQSPWPWLGLANLSHQAGDLEGARELYVEALSRDPAHVAARHNLAETLAALGCLDRARAEIEGALTLARGTPLEERVAQAAQRLAQASGGGECGAEE